MRDDTFKHRLNMRQDELPVGSLTDEEFHKQIYLKAIEPGFGIKVVENNPEIACREDFETWYLSEYKGCEDHLLKHETAPVMPAEDGEPELPTGIKAGAYVMHRVECQWFAYRGCWMRLKVQQ